MAMDRIRCCCRTFRNLGWPCGKSLQTSPWHQRQRKHSTWTWRFPWPVRQCSVGYSRLLDLPLPHPIVKTFQSPIYRSSTSCGIEVLLPGPTKYYFPGHRSICPFWTTDNCAKPINIRKCQMTVIEELTRHAIWNIIAVPGNKVCPPSFFQKAP